MTGYWFLEREESWQPPHELTAFLEAGDPPVVVSFGSISGQDPARSAEIVIEALRKTGERGILVTGWGGLEATDLPNSVLQIRSAPYEWLFPQSAAVVHHGGAGTTAAGLRAGKPSVVCPFFGDQPFWGHRVEELGVGPAPLPQSDLNTTTLARAIERAVDNGEMQREAAQIGAKIRDENGVDAAVRFIERYVGETV
jgi:sterol 3beta-glucosyltransferase